MQKTWKFLKPCYCIKCYDTIKITFSTWKERIRVEIFFFFVCLHVATIETKQYYNKQMRFKQLSVSAKKNISSVFMCGNMNQN